MKFKKWVNVLLFAAITGVVLYLIFKASTVLAAIAGVGVVSASCFLAQICDRLDDLKDLKEIKKK